MIGRPTLTVTVDGRALTGPEAAVAAMTVELRAAPAHDRVRLTLGPLSPLLDTAPGAELVVAIGRAGDEGEALLTGTVTNAWHRPWGTVLEGLASTIACSRTAVGRSYVRQGVDQIVRDLASAAEVDVDQAEGGVELAVFHADDRRPVWRHLLALAQLTGSEVVAAPSGGLRFRQVRTGAADHTLRAGAELLDWAVGARQPAPAPAATAALVAAGDSDGWHLLGHEPDGGGRSLLNPAVRDRSAARAWGDGLTATNRRGQAGGWATTMGDVGLRAGDLVELVDTSRADATYRIVSATHVLDRAGYRTALALEGAA